MMDSNNIFSRRTLGVNNKVWLTISILAVITVGVLSYTSIDKDNCLSFTIDVGEGVHMNDDYFFTGEKIPFKTSISNSRITWNFNDSSNAVVGKDFITHTFTREGKYYITASTNPGCESLRLITIIDRSKEGLAIDTVASAIAPQLREIIGTSSTFTSREEEFMPPPLGGATFEWIVLNHPELGKRNTEKARFLFARPGRYIIQVTLDYDPKKRYAKQINVEDIMKPQIQLPEYVPPVVNNIPPPPKKEEPIITTTPVVKPSPQTTTPPKIIIPPSQPVTPPAKPILPPVAAEPKTIRVADQTFKSLLQVLVDNQMVESDFYKYLCEAGSTLVIVNGDSQNRKTFSWLCKEISGKKTKKGLLSKKTSITIEYVKLHRDDDPEKCVTKIDVRY
ncbi:MAG: PKD domain-containing protein [Ferruginibacter sp.]